MSQTLTLYLKGLFTSANEYSSTPDGALSIADNIVIDRESIAESRRGFTRLPYTLPSSSDRADKLGQYQNKLLVHYNNTSLAYYNGGVHTYSGSYSHPDSSLAKIRFAEANSNLYFTSSTGIKKLDVVTGTPTQAGMFKGLDCKAVASTNASGFMSNNTQVAYRVVWGITDTNQNLVLGYPSQRTILTNASGGLQDASIQISIPSGVTTSHFFQIYRSNQSATSTTTPDDNMQLVYEANPTSGQIAALSATVIDSVPDSLRGAALYTNDTQDGILQANELPPYANDICVFRNCLFFGNTRTKQRLSLSLLSVGGTKGLQLNDTITIAGITYTAKASENVGALQFALVTSGSASQNINDTALSLIRVINQNSSTIYAYYLSSTSSLPGLISLEERILGGSTFAVVSSAYSTAFLPILPSSGTTVSSSNTTSLNGLTYSKQQIPEAVPIINTLFAGSASKKILRIIPLRDSLFILKEDGVYRLTGTSPSNFSVDLLDSTAILIAPESAVALNNKIYALTTQGIVAIADTGVEVISRPIENTITQLFGSALTAVQTYSFGVSYESDHKYILWTVSGSGETYCSQAFVYNIFTKTWVRWTRSQGHGLVLTADDKLYCTDPLSNNLVQERKDNTFTDFSDEEIPITLVSSSGYNLVLSDVSGIVVGDSIYQSTSIASIVTAIDPAVNIVTVTDNLNSWVPGASYILKSIPCTIEWVPSSGKNPGMNKHFREAVLLFKQNYFSTASVNFYSDISGASEMVPFNGVSGGSWGTFVWGTGALWGGISRSTPFRTYIPSEKQRCDLLTVQFQCQNVWARFQLEGLSLVLNGISERVN